jgi:hypothetical protein
MERSIISYSRKHAWNTTWPISISQIMKKGHKWQNLNIFTMNVLQTHTPNPLGWYACVERHTFWDILCISERFEISRVVRKREKNCCDMRNIMIIKERQLGAELKPSNRPSRWPLTVQSIPFKKILCEQYASLYSIVCSCPYIVSSDWSYCGISSHHVMNAWLLWV